MRQGRSAIIALLFSTASTQAGYAPPNTPGLAWPMGQLGAMDPSTNQQRSFDSGQQGVGTAPWSEYWYTFNLVTPPGGSYPLEFVKGGDATITILDKMLKPIAPLDGATKPTLQNGLYYVHVAASHHTYFRFGIFVPPPFSQFPNDAGRSEASALNLGQLNKLLVHSSSFYTLFTRVMPADNSTNEGPVPLDYAKPIPNPPIQSDFYTFTMAAQGFVRLDCFSSSFGEPNKGGPSFVLKTPSGEHALWETGQSKTLSAGLYVLQVVDKRTQTDGTVSFRQSTFEDFETYKFQLLLQ